MISSNGLVEISLRIFFVLVVIIFDVILKNTDDLLG
jgi:hypothetical protein